VNKPDEFSAEVIKDIQEVQTEIDKLLENVPNNQISLPMEVILNMKLDALIKLLISNKVIRGEDYALQRVKEEKVVIETVLNKQKTKSKLIIPERDIKKV